MKYGVFRTSYSCGHLFVPEGIFIPGAFKNIHGLLWQIQGLFKAHAKHAEELLKRALLKKNQTCYHLSQNNNPYLNEIG